MNTDTLRAVVDELVAADWHALDPQETDPLVPVVQALQRHRVRADDRAVRVVFDALEARRPEPEPEPYEDLHLPAPTVEELAEEAAWWVDLLFMFSLHLQAPGKGWSFENDNVDLNVSETVPVSVRRTCHRAGLTVAAKHEVPDRAPSMRQVCNALIRRLAKDGRLSSG